MTYRRPKEITHKGVCLSDALRAHRLWVFGYQSGERLDWRGADLNKVWLDGASLVDASLEGACLNCASLNRVSLGGARMNRVSLIGALLDSASLDGASLVGASLNYASLDRASLDRASLDGVSLIGATGNMREIKSAQFDTWPITWTTAPDGVVTLQIGCQKHPLNLWIKSDPRWIAAMGDDATEWWTRYRDPVLALVQASPAKPWGEPK
jgi:hypothetical protein